MTLTLMTARSHIRRTTLRQWQRRIDILAIMLASIAVPARSDSTCHGPQSLEAAARNHASAPTLAALGGWFGEHQQYACAAREFRAALHFDPSSARLHYALGLSLNAGGKPTEALDELRRSIQLDGNRIEPRLLAGFLLNESGQRGEAEEEWEAALRVDPESTVALDWLAKARIADEQYAAAIDLLTSSPRDLELTLDLTLAYSRNGQFDKAAEVLQDALQKQPNELSLITALATVYVQSHRYQDAQNLIKQALLSHPDDTATEMLYLKLLVMQDDFASARPLAQKLLTGHPNDFDALYLSGIIDVEDQKDDLAIEHLGKAVALNPDHYDVRYNLGIALARQQKYKEALEEFTKAVALAPNEAQAHFHRAQVLRALGKNSEAQTELILFQQRQQATVKEALGQTKAGQASQAMKDGHPEQAASLYREAVAAQPDKASYEYDLAIALSAAGDAVGEREALTKAIELNPRFAIALNLLGTLDVQSEEFHAAETHFRAALHAAPRYADAANNLGTLLGSQGRDQEAEIQFRSAVSANPRFTQAWLNLAATMASESRFAEAQSAVESALRLDPQNADGLRLKQLLAQQVAASQAGSVHGSSPKDKR